MIESAQSEFQWKHAGHQYYAVFSASLIMFSQGCTNAWFAPAIPLLMSENSPLATGPLTLEHVSWIGSINCVGALGGSYTFGFITSLMGCKRALTFLAIPATIFWLIIIFGDSFYQILMSRFIAGWISASVESISVLYAAEIANDNIRGSLSTIAQLARNVGFLLAFITGAVLSYAQNTYIYICLPIVFIITFIFLPNTPLYLLQHGKLQEAEKSLKFYKNYKGKTEIEEHALKNEFERLKSLTQEREGNESVHIKDVCEKKALRGLLITVALAFFAQATGCYVILTYTVTIFQKSGTYLSPHLSSIILAIAQIIGNLFTTQLADILGRKILLIITFFGSALGLLSMGIYMYLFEQGYELSSFTWVPVISLSSAIFFTSVGIYPLGIVCAVESLPAKVRTLGVSIYVSSLNLFAFFCAKFYPIILEIIQMHGCMMLFVTGCILGIFFVYFAMEETKGKSVDTIDPKQTITGVETFVNVP